MDNQSINKNLEKLHEKQKMAMDSIKTGESVLDETFNSALLGLAGPELEKIRNLKNDINKMLTKAKKGGDYQSDIAKIKKHYGNSSHR